MLKRSTNLVISSKNIRFFSVTTPSTSSHSNANNGQNSASLEKKLRIKPREDRYIVQSQRKRNEELEKKAKAAKLPWRIMGATILHRYPTIQKTLEPWELEFNLLEEEFDLRRRQIVAEKVKDSPSEILATNELTLPEAFENSFFRPAPRITEADKTNDRRSIERRMEDSLFLIVKRNRSDHAWQFPQGKYVDDDKNLQACADRVIKRAAGPHDVHFFGPAPAAHFCYEYPKAVQEKRGNFGAKVFYYRTQFLAPAIRLETKLYKDYAWIARDELKEYFDKDTAEFLHYVLPN